MKKEYQQPLPDDFPGKGKDRGRDIEKAEVPDYHSTPPPPPPPPPKSDNTDQEKVNGTSD